jgi:hypothetical protein
MQSRPLAPCSAVVRGGQLDLLHNAAIIDKAEAKEADEASRTVKYVDLSKMDEVYDRVRDWQETGKKKFK